MNRAVFRSLLPAFSAFARDLRAAAAIELALGAVALVSTSALCFDLYSRVKADAACGRMAAAMADYVSRDAAPDGNQMKALGEFLHRRDLRTPAGVVYVITAIHQPPGPVPPSPPPEVLYTDDTIRFGDPAVTAELAAGCARHVDAGGNPRLPVEFTMAEGETVIIAELCARLTREGSITGRFVAGDIYRVHALPARDQRQVPVAPAYVERSAPPGAGAIASLDAGETVGA